TPPLAIPLIAAVQNGGSYALLRANMQLTPPRVTMRLLTHDGGLNYHDLHLARHPDGGIVIHDMYIMVTGELVTQTLRRGWFLGLPENVQNSQTLRAKLHGPDREFFDNMQKLASMAR